MNVRGLRSQIGDALWLLLLFRLHAIPVNNREFYFCNGGPVSDAGCAAALEVSEATARRWRRRLEQEDLIRTERVSRHRFNCWCRAMKYWAAPLPVPGAADTETVEGEQGGKKELVQ